MTGSNIKKGDWSR